MIEKTKIMVSEIKENKSLWWVVGLRRLRSVNICMPNRRLVRTLKAWACKKSSFLFDITRTKNAFELCGG